MLELNRLLTRFDLSEYARKLVEPADTPLVLLTKLVKQKLWIDAINVLANWLLKRRAVEWGCVCIEFINYPLSVNEEKALQAAKNWVKDDQENLRRLAFLASEKAGLGTAAGCIALAAFWSGGSMAPIDAPVIFPADHLCHHAVASSIMLAIAKVPDQAESFYPKLIDLGVTIVNKE